MGTTLHKEVSENPISSELSGILRMALLRGYLQFNFSHLCDSYANHQQNETFQRLLEVNNTSECDISTLLSSIAHFSLCLYSALVRYLLQKVFIRVHR